MSCAPRKAAMFGKRSNCMRRNPKAEVSKQGWLYKQVKQRLLTFIIKAEHHWFYGINWKYGIHCIWKLINNKVYKLHFVITLAISHTLAPLRVNASPQQRGILSKLNSKDLRQCPCVHRVAPKTARWLRATIQLRSWVGCEKLRLFQWSLNQRNYLQFPVCGAVEAFCLSWQILSLWSHSHSHCTFEFWGRLEHVPLPVCWCSIEMHTIAVQCKCLSVTTWRH